MNSIIEIHGLSKTFEDKRKIFNQMDFIIPQGAWCMITGSSGVGKTTLLFILALLDPASKGQYFFNQQKIFENGKFLLSHRELARLRLAHIGILYQEARLLPTLNVLENIELPHWLLTQDKKEALKKAEELCERLDLLEQRTSNPKSLSGGEKQRVALARALINQPELLLTDEPTGSLSGEHASQLMELLKEHHQKGNTIITVTHDLSIKPFGTIEHILQKQD